MGLLGAVANASFRSATASFFSLFRCFERGVLFATER